MDGLAISYTIDVVPKTKPKNVMPWLTMWILCYIVDLLVQLFEFILKDKINTSYTIQIVIGLYAIVLLPFYENPI